MWVRASLSGARSRQRKFGAPGGRGPLKERGLWSKERKWHLSCDWGGRGGGVVAAGREVVAPPSDACWQSLAWNT